MNRRLFLKPPPTYEQDPSLYADRVAGTLPNVYKQTITENGNYQQNGNFTGVDITVNVPGSVNQDNVITSFECWMGGISAAKPFSELSYLEVDRIFNLQPSDAIIIFTVRYFDDALMNPESYNIEYYYNYRDIPFDYYYSMQPKTVVKYFKGFVQSYYIDLYNKSDCAVRNIWYHNKVDYQNPAYFEYKPYILKFKFE